MDRKTIQGRLRALVEEGEGIFGAATKDKRTLTDEETKRIAAIETEIEACRSGLAAADKGNSWKRTVNELRRFPEPDVEPEGWSDGENAGQGPLVTRSYKEACARTNTDYSLGEWGSAGEFFAALVSGRHHPNLRSATGGNDTYSDQDGGFVVPTPIVGRILDGALESEIVRPRALVMPMDSATLKVPLWQNSDRSGGQVFNGISATWAAEGGALDTQVPQLEMVTLQAKKLAFLGKMPNELPEDSPFFVGEFERALASAASFHLDEAFLNGAGASTPQGILNAPATISVAPETGQAAASIVYENLAEMFSRMLPASRSNSVWVCNNSAIPQLLRLSVPVGTGGAHVSVLTESGGGFRMLTRPVVFTEKAPALGSAGDVMLCDFSQYLIGMRVGVSIMVSPHAAFTSDSTLWRLRMRVDGKPLVSKPVTPKNGATLSAFVKLAART